jgi:hypothetical protein
VDWIIFQNKKPLETKTTAVVFFDNIVHEKLEYAGRNDGSIWVCGRRNYVALLPPPGKEDQPNDLVISDLIAYSERFIRQGGNTDGEKALDWQLSQSRAFRLFTVSGLPFISDIPSKYLLSSAENHSVPSGVFICYGHGSYGQLICSEALIIFVIHEYLIVFIKSRANLSQYANFKL